MSEVVTVLRGREPSGELPEVVAVGRAGKLAAVQLQAEIAEKRRDMVWHVVEMRRGYRKGIGITWMSMPG